MENHLVSGPELVACSPVHGLRTTGPNLSSMIRRDSPYGPRPWNRFAGLYIPWTKQHMQACAIRGSNITHFRFQMKGISIMYIIFNLSQITHIVDKTPEHSNSFLSSVKKYIPLVIYLNEVRHDTWYNTWWYDKCYDRTSTFDYFHQF